MLAASGGRSNVLPDDLQATPLVAGTRIAREQFRVPQAALALRTNPGESPEYDAVSLQRYREPFPVAIPYLDVATGPQPYGKAIGLAALQPGHLQPKAAKPASAEQETPLDGER